MPFNVRLARQLKRLPGLRRYADQIASLPFIPASGTFRYGPDCIIHFDGHNSQFHALYEPCYHAGYELETCLLLQLLLTGNGTFVDAGSNWGYFALSIAQSPAFTGNCVCYEPHPKTFRDLKSCIAQAGLAQRVIAKQLGLGDTEQELYLQTVGGKSGLTRLSQAKNEHAVRVTTLDSEPLDNTSLIKIDVEGMELSVLMGASSLLKSQRPWLILENFLDYEEPDSTLQPIRWLQQHDYAVFMPNSMVRHRETSLPHHYGSPPPKHAADLDRTQMQFFRVTEANRFLLHPQVNLLACPVEKITSLPGEILS
jgi:FkbM family methyltransferase